MTSDANEVNAPRVAFDMALWQLTEQQRSIEGLDTKAGTALTASLAFLGLFGLSVTLAADADVTESIVAAIVSGAIVLAAFVWVLVAFRWAIETTNWAHGPDGRYLIEVGTGHTEGEVLEWLIERVVDSYEENDELLQRKAIWFSRMLVAVIAQGIAATIGLVLVAAVSSLA